MSSEKSNIKISQISVTLGTVWKILVALGVVIVTMATAMNLYFLPRYEYAKDNVEMKGAIMYMEKIFKEAEKSKRD